MMTRTQGAITAKAAMQLVGVLEHRTMRPPLLDATEDEIALLRADLAESGLLEEPGDEARGVATGPPLSHPHPELGPPPPLPPADCACRARWPGRDGRNMTVFEYAGRLLVVDCGVLFPEDDQPGVDLILPDFDYIRGPPRRHRGGRAHPRTRGPHRRRAVPAARAARTSRWSARG